MTPAKPFPCGHCQKGFLTIMARMDHQRDVHGIDLGKPAPSAAQDPACGECGKIAALVSGESIYPHRPDLYGKRFWLCECGAYCGCHGLTDRPLGFPAGAETRRARNAAHEAFDPIWRSGGYSRRSAYTWLSTKMNLPPEECHIGMMPAADAWRVVELCQARRKAA